MSQLELPGIVKRGTVREALDWLMAHGLDGCAKWTVRQHEDHRRWLLEWLDARGIEALDALTYERLCEYRDSEGPRGRGCMIATVKKRLVTLRMALKEAHRRGLIVAVPPWPKLKSDSRPGERIILPAEYQTMRARIAAERWRLWLDLAYQTGQRREDVHTMRWWMIRLGSREFLRRSTKTHARPEWMPMPDELHEILTYASERYNPTEMERIAGRWANVNRDMAIACLDAGIPHTGPNDLRRTRESILRAQGANPAFIQLFMCHSEAIARKHYIRPTPELLRAGAESMKIRAA